MTKLKNSTASVVTTVTDGMLTFGVELKNYTSNDCKFDHFTLEYLGDEATGIHEVRGLNEAVQSPYYNLNGQSVAKPARGLYIVNGKKVLVK